ncbi:hypothetical protein JS528_05185 [Bifidobacterium sp. MA2]|uniref:Lipoprotein n=1 Tax=Bifidobacterium santillanense TaxID=2809028 RepID=A0ABS5UP88_9BIFI|nr:hypothetical protein [Bifidobacterium santillanense]MBT1172755.1 hypothetical protein [Bifidobacterium santillanense]
MSRRFVIAALILCFSFFSVSGCGYTVSSEQKNAGNSSNEISTSDGTSFRGIYASQFRKAYDGTKSDLVKKILKDGGITKAEISEFETTYAQCLASKGLKLTNHLDASSEVHTSMIDNNMSADEANNAREYCDTTTGYDNLMPLYQQISTNPNNISADAFDGKIVDCLKKHNLVDKSMTVKDYKQLMNDDEEYAKLMEKMPDKQQQFHECEVNPMDLQ